MDPLQNGINNTLTEGVNGSFLPTQNGSDSPLAVQGAITPQYNVMESSMPTMVPPATDSSTEEAHTISAGTFWKPQCGLPAFPDVLL